VRVRVRVLCRWAFGAALAANPPSSSFQRSRSHDHYQEGERTTTPIEPHTEREREREKRLGTLVVLFGVCLRASEINLWVVGGCSSTVKSLLHRSIGCCSCPHLYLLLKRERVQLLLSPILRPLLGVSALVDRVLIVRWLALCIVCASGL